MIKLFTVTVIALCLILSVGFIGIAGADDMKAQGEEMINVNRTLDIDEKAAVVEGEEALDTAEMKEEAAEMTEIQEMADEKLKETDEK